MRVALGAVVTTAGWAGVVVLLHRGTSIPTVVFVGALWLVTAGLTRWATRGAAPRRALLVVGLAAVVVQLPGLVTPPLTSSDAYRYVWDGRVQLSGTSPYRYAPLDDRLAALRDPVLFPGLGPADRSGYLTEPVPTDRSALAVRAKDDPRTRINRPRVPTIYPPVAQAWFTAVAAVTPWSAGTRGLQVGSALLAVAVAVALAALARRSGRHPLGALWWAWSPLVLLETGNGAHVDIVSAVLLVAAVAVGGSSSARRWVAGVVVGLAGAVKLFPSSWSLRSRRWPSAAGGGRYRPRWRPSRPCWRLTCLTCWSPAPWCSATSPATSSRRGRAVARPCCSCCSPTPP